MAFVRKKGRTCFAWVLAAMMLLQMMGTALPALAASGTAKTLAELRTLLSGAQSGDVITITGTITGDGADPLAVPNGVTLTGGTLNKINLTSAGTLTLKGITITGNEGVEFAVQASNLTIQGAVSITGANAAQDGNGQVAVNATGTLKLSANAVLTSAGGRSYGNGYFAGDAVRAGGMQTGSNSRINATGGSGTQSGQTFAGHGGRGLIIQNLKTSENLPSGKLGLELNGTIKGGAGGSSTDVTSGGNGAEALVIENLEGNGVTLLGNYTGGTGGNGAVYGGKGGTGLSIATITGTDVVTFAASNTGGEGGSGSLTGGQGGHGFYVGSLKNPKVILAGKSAGGQGGQGAVSGGDGGQGGTGLWLDQVAASGSVNIELRGMQTGGSGGKGGAGQDGGVGGTGGTGGFGIKVRQASGSQSITIAGNTTVSGGNGGVGGDSSTGNGGFGGKGNNGVDASGGSFAGAISITGINSIKFGAGALGGKGYGGTPQSKRGSDGVTVAVSVSAKVEVAYVEPLENIDIAMKSGDLEGYSVKVNPVYAPLGAKPMEIEWSSSNEQAITVQDGVLTAKSRGNATATSTITLTVTTHDGQTFTRKFTARVTQAVDPEKFAIKPETLEMRAGTAAKALTVGISRNASTKYQWISDNPEVATVDYRGYVTPISEGTAIISATVLDGSNDTATIEVTVLRTPITGIRLLPASLTMGPGQQESLDVTYTPANASDKRVTYASDTPSVATVDINGVVTAIKQGKAIITATSVDGEKTARTTITVVDLTVTGVTVAPVSAKVKVAANTTLKATVLPKGSNQTVTWTSSNNSIATVDNAGKVTGVSQGTAQITARTLEGGFTASATVTVEGSLVTISPGSLKMQSGDSATVKATVASAAGSTPTIVWISGNTRIATVDQKGNVRAYQDGRTTITAWVDGGKMSGSIEVVVGNVDVTSVKITPATMTLAPGMGQALQAEILPNSALVQDVTWHSSNPNVVTVDKYGRILAVASKGQATIVATSVDGQKTGKTVVNIGEVAITNVSIKAAATTIAPGSSLNLSYVLEPVDAPVSRVQWSSSNPQVAVINTSGRVSALRTGTTTIIVKVTDGTGKASVKEASLVLNVQQGGSTQPMSGMVIAGKLNVREGGNGAAQVLGTLARGEVVNIIKQLGNWYQIQYNGRTAYTSAQYVTADRTAMVYSNTLTVRLSPNSSARRLGTLLYGDRVTVLGTTGSWYKIDYRGITGYVAAQHMVLTPTEQVGVINSSVLTVRERAGSGYAAVGTLSQGDVVPVIGREGAWLRVEYGGRVAYVAASHVRIQ